MNSACGVEFVQHTKDLAEPTILMTILRNEAEEACATNAHHLNMPFKLCGLSNDIEASLK
jgi:hypothetical protein